MRSAEERTIACLLWGTSIATGIWTVALCYESIPCAILLASITMALIGAGCSYARQSMRTLTTAQRWHEAERGRL